jgi:type IV pilus assembly protein PilP
MIKKDQILSSLSYVGVGLVSILTALWISSSLLQKASTQEEPPAAAQEAPPETLPSEEGAAPPQEGEPEDAAAPEMEEGMGADSSEEMDPALETPPDATGAESPDQLRTEVQSFLEPFIYDPKGRRDPFRPYTEVLVTEGEPGSPAGPVLPLQRFDLDQLRLIGIIWDVAEPKAMFLDPNSRIYTVGRDERIGPNNGYIAAIREGEVVVVESIRRRGESEPVYTPRVIRMER